MARTERAAWAPARARVGLPIIPDGSREHPLLLRLPGRAPACNNGCAECLARAVEGEESAWDAGVEGRHVVLRDGEPTQRRELPALVRALKKRRPSSIAL
ncbi:MAG: hypothetical protein FWD17_00665, partial [Polyangiaceae bacterium]|nr:hypothetical protein [Polyangiaceae bacterium]